MDPTQLKLDDLFKDLVWDSLVKAALAELFLIAPWLAWGPVGFVVSFIAQHFSDQLYKTLSLAVQMEAIVIKNEEHKRAFDRASVKLKVMAKEKGIDSPEFEKLREEQKQALADFVRFGS
jgi:hypothetical protein